MSGAGGPSGATRRGLFGAAAGLAGLVGARSALAGDSLPDHPPLIKTSTLVTDRVLPFYGPNQNGIITPIQAHTYFAALDIVTAKVADIAALMQRWTEAAAKMTQGVASGRRQRCARPARHPIPARSATFRRAG